MKRTGIIIGVWLIAVVAVFADITTGLVAYYPFEGNADDASGNGWDGTNFVGAVQYVPFSPVKIGLWPAVGKKGQAAWFDALSAIELPYPKLLDGASNATITAWVWFADRYDGQILGQGDAYQDPVIATSFNPAESKATQVHFGSVPYNPPRNFIGFADGESVQGIGSGKWIMITLVLKSQPPGCAFRCYVDGALVKESTNQWFTRIAYPEGPGFNGMTLIGAINARSPEQGFYGCIDELRIYSRALERSDILELFYDGSDPNLRIEVSHVRLCWFTPTNKTSQLQYRSPLTSNEWLNLGVAIPGTGSTTCITDAVDGPQRFYRVLYLP